MSYKLKTDSSYAFGSVKSVTQNNGDVALIADGASLNITPYNDAIIRVDVNFLEKEEYFSYAVNQQPKASCQFTLEKKSNLTRLIGNLFDININLKKGLLTIKDKKGKIILEDEKGLGTLCLGTEITAFKTLHEDEKFFGLGEKTGDFNKRGNFYTHKNTDSFAFSPTQDPTYASIPFFIGVHSGLMYGIFVDNTQTTQFDFGTSTDRYFSFNTESGNLHYYFIYGTSVAEIVKQYTWLTGRMPMPPLWAIGFHQSRYSYYPEYKMYEVIKGFENRNIPLDAVHFDIHYMDAYKAFTFDKKKFPNPKGLIGAMNKKGIKAIPILDPGIKVEPKYKPYEEGIKKDMFVKYVDKELYQGGVWPGMCHFPDFTNPKVRRWWIALCKFYTNLGIEGLWNDMNEPAVWGQQFPAHTLFNYDGNETTFKKARNVYGLLMSRASFEGLKQADKNKRYFLLTRAAYAGIQRYATKWTGDNIANDEHLLLTARMVNSLGISGIPFAGSDVGGFVDNSDGFLFARWIALGCFTPFFRAHKMINANSSEPWSFGEEVEQIAKNYIQLRYRLIPYLYTQFFSAATSGKPINQAMAFVYPHDEWAYHKKFQNQFLYGDNMLVCPVDTQTEHLPIYLPKGNWFNYYSDKIQKGDKEILHSTDKFSIPVFIKEGSILFMQKPLLHLNKGIDSTIEVHIYLDEKSTLPTAEGLLYLDDGQTLDYQKKEKYTLLSFGYDRVTNTLTISKLHTKFKSKVKQFKIFLHGIQQKKITVIQGKLTKSVMMRPNQYVILEAIPNFDPFVNKAKGLKSVSVFEGGVTMFN